MNSEYTNKNLNFLSREELLLIRKEKVKLEIASAKRILESGVEPLKVADQFIHNSFKLMEDGIIKRNPKANSEKIKKIVKANLALMEKIKSFKKKGE